jgi:hypothetical protein
MANVQLTGDEITCVWQNIDNGQILGFGPKNFKFPGCHRAICIPLYHAHEIDKWANAFRNQQQDEHDGREYARFLREEPIRKRLRDKLKARRDQVGPLQRADIDRGLAMLDALEARLAKRKLEGALLIERYDSSKRKEDIALESAVFKPQDGLALLKVN